MRRPGSHPGYTIYELADLLGITPRTIWHWSREGVFMAPPFRGKYTRYDDSHAAQLRRIIDWRDQNLSLDTIRQRIDQEPLPVAPPKHTRAATEAPPSVSAPPTAAAASTSHAIKSNEAPQLVGHPPGERWERMTLVPGVELHVNLAIGPYVRTLVDDIWQRFGAAGGQDEEAEPAP